MNEVPISPVGNLTSDPELNFGPSGTPYARFTVAQTPRKKGANGEFEDDDTMFFRCTAFGSTAENVAASLHKGDRVLVVGRMKVSNYEKDGQQRQSMEVLVDHVGPELKWAQVTGLQRATGGGGGGQRGGGQRQQQGGGDPWGSAPQGGQQRGGQQRQGGLGGYQDDEPPF